jgi:hypothetical protein
MPSFLSYSANQPNTFLTAWPRRRPLRLGRRRVHGHGRPQLRRLLGDRHGAEPLLALPTPRNIIMVPKTIVFTIVNPYGKYFLGQITSPWGHNRARRCRASCRASRARSRAACSTTRGPSPYPWPPWRRTFVLFSADWPALSSCWAHLPPAAPGGHLACRRGCVAGVNARVDLRRAVLVPGSRGACSHGP